MSSPGGDEVGRVSVRVLPDTSDFARKLREELRDLRDLTAKVKPDLDEEELRRQVEEIRDTTVDVKVKADVENLRDDIERATAGARANQVDVPLGVDEAQLEAAVEAAAAAAEASVDPVDIPATIDEAGLQAEIARIEAQLEALDGKRVTPHVELLQASFQAQLAEVRAQLAALGTEKVEIPVSVQNGTEARAEIVGIQAAAEALGRNPILLKFELDQDQLLAEMAAVEAELAALDDKVATPEVRAAIDKGLANLKRIDLALDELDARHAEAILDMDVETLGADAHIREFIARQRERKIVLDLDIDKDRLGFVTSGLAGSFANVFSGIASGIGNALKGIGGMLGGLGDAFEQGASQAGKMLGTVASIGTTLATVVGIGTALAVAGAAVTVAWGAAATAIAAVPGAIGLLGAAAGTVMLGLDGIKAAAKSIKPEFDALKKSVSDTFEKGLTPIFQNLATIFPKIEGNVKNVASALVSTASTLTAFITSERGLALLNTTLYNTFAALEGMQPGIRDTVDGFLTLAAQSGVFEALTSAVNTFGAQFKKNLTDTLRDGSLVSAFAGLRGMLDQLAIGFSDLVKNGIEVFAAAAPGVNSFLKDLTAFFNRFNWKTLGTAVGGVFEGLGQSLKEVPPETIKEIEDAFTQLGETFKSPEVKDGIKGLVGALPPLIKLFSGLAKDVAPIAEDVGGLVKNFQELDQKVREFTDWWNGDNLDPAPGGIDGILTADAPWWKSTMDFLDRMIQGVKDKFDELKRVLSGEDFGKSPIGSLLGGSVGDGGKNPFGDLFNFDFGLPDLPTFDDIEAPGFGLDWFDLDDQVKGFIDDMSFAASGALGEMTAVVTNGLAAVRAAFTFEGVGTALGLAFLGMVGTTKLGMDSIAATVTTGMAGVNAAFNFATVGQTLGLAFLGMVGTVTLGMASLAAAVTTGMVLVNAAFNFATVGTSLGLAFLGMVGTVTLGMQSIATAVTTGMVLVNAAFNFATVGITLGLAFQGMVGTTTLGMASIAAAVTTGMAAVYAAFNFANVGLQFGLVFQQMVGTATLGMAAIVAVVTAGMAAINAAIAGGMGGILGFWAANWATAGSVVVGAFAVIAGAVRGGMAGALGAITSGLSGILGFWRANWQTMVTVVSGAFPGILGAIRGGIASAITTIRGFASQFQGVGRFLMEGLKTGIMAMVGPIAAAARAVVEGALRAARAAGIVASPSKAFMVIGEYFGEGMAIGIENSASRVADAAGSMVDSAVGAADKIADAFAGDKWASDFSAKVEQSFGDLDPTVSNKDVVGAIKRQSGDLDSSSQLSTMIAILGAMLTELRGGGGTAAAGAQGSRRVAELGAF